MTACAAGKPALSRLVPRTARQTLTVKELLRRHGQSLGSEDLLCGVHQRGDRSTRLVCGESISLGNELLDFRGLDGCGLLRVLDIGDPLVVVVSDPS
jgi:hypothetical protein